MILGAHEAYELSELLLSCTNSIQSMALFLNQAQDPELRDMISRHYAVHIQDYNMKVEFASKMQGSQDQLDVPKLTVNPMTPATASVTAGNIPIQPQVKLNQLDDRGIATSYLLTLKRAGREYAWATFECSTVQLRVFLEDAFRMCSHQAFEVWNYMVRKGWYMVAKAPDQTLQTMGQMYQEVPFHQPMNVYR
ncbi:spore coat protein CotF [Fontibacillus phaseoli]|uniref:Spore coat protein CotF n=1 Tax=Fontibacillus phaseoli TaxID=1416533 RepID=A0A369BN45_9BACL|nr:spore coat protein [Fontibacillus phaseoli]RCX22505.1 spore coat protein CotF [Fontibacillus phaseoli]